MNYKFNPEITSPTNFSKEIASIIDGKSLLIINTKKFWEIRVWSLFKEGSKNYSYFIKYLKPDETIQLFNLK